MGFCGVSVLLFHNGEQHFGIIPCLAILAGATPGRWGRCSTARWTCRIPGALTSGAAMVLGGGMLLLLSAAFGELHPLPHFRCVPRGPCSI